MKIAAIVQARMGSERLPGKVLKDLGGATMLERVVGRVSRSSRIDDLLVATSIRPADDAIALECQRLRVNVFRGSEQDVLDRYYYAALQTRADAVLRVTADCPLIDPALLNELLDSFVTRRPDYASNCLIRSYPRGLDAEVMTCGALSRAWREATVPYQRQHVTPYLYENPSEFSLFSLACSEDHSEFRWTVDTTEDLELARAVYLHFADRDDFGWRDVLSLMNVQPQLVHINRNVRQRSLQEG